MPVNYARDDVRRLITVSMQGPFETRNLVDTVDRQIAEGTWAYARVYDERGVTVATRPRRSDGSPSAGTGRRESLTGLAVESA